MAISLYVLPQRTRFNEAEARAPRAHSTSRHLTLRDAIWHRRSAGEAQHKIAAAFDVNQDRISEILSGKRFPAAKRLAQNSPIDSGASQG